MARVAVLSGGLSPERPVSLSSGAGCVAALRRLGHEVIEIDPQNPGWIAELQDVAPDAVLHCILLIHLRTRLAFTPFASATPAPEAPRAAQASTTRALNSALCRRLVRFAGALLSVRSSGMVSTFFMVDTIGHHRHSIKMHSSDAYERPLVQDLDRSEAGARGLTQGLQREPSSQFSQRHDAGRIRP